MEEKNETAETPKEEVVVKAKRGPKPKKAAVEQPSPEQNSTSPEETPAPKERKRAVRKVASENQTPAVPKEENLKQPRQSRTDTEQKEQQPETQKQTEPQKQPEPQSQNQAESQNQTEPQNQNQAEQQEQNRSEQQEQNRSERQNRSRNEQQEQNRNERQNRNRNEQQEQNRNERQNRNRNEQQEQNRGEQQNHNYGHHIQEQPNPEQSGREQNGQEQAAQQEQAGQEQNNQEHQNNQGQHYSYDDNREYRYNKRNKGRHNNQQHQQQRKNFPEKSRPARTRYLELLKENEESIRKTAHDYQISRTSSMTFPEVTFEVFKNVVESEGGGISACKGILEILADGYGFLRTQMCSIESTDVYVSNAQIKKLGLRTGDYVVGQTRPPKDNESYQALLRVECINDMEPDRARRTPSFDNLTPLYPNQRFNLHVEDNDPSVRIVDLVTPIGKGQRGLIVAPPKAGKTTLLKQIANALTSNHPDIVLFVLLIDERPEEVTDMTRSVEGEVFASTFDQQLNNHIRVSEMVLERAKRLVEQGKDVVILLDSITRLARAYNIAVPSTGQTLSGGVNPLALYKPKKFFGSARKIEFGGSLTILATALIDTGSKMDDVIFEEFKGTGNMELHLDRTLFNKRIFPSINLSKSSTRREELLVPPEALKGMTILRRVFESVSAQEAIELLKKQVKQSRDNELLLSTLLRSADLKNI